MPVDNLPDRSYTVVVFGGPKGRVSDEVSGVPLGQVVRSLRTQAGVTILKARELTQYQNYERWESGDTRVAPTT